MQSKTLERFNEALTKFNALETASRTQYHNYLVREKGEKESLRQHLEAYASLSTFGQPVAEQAIQEIAPAVPFPADLVAFYRTQGWFYGGTAFQVLTVFSLEKLLGMYGADYAYQQFHSLGLADMINFQWDNDRDELDVSSEQAIFTQEHIDYLNSSYIVVATWEDYSWGSEAHFYIYYDRQGCFGIFHLHQDTWKIEHMFDESPARQTWDQVMNEALDRILKRSENS
ncbi:MAG: hypothetical protein ABWY06_01205 [Pseudomonas sp.]|uniref:hypothetical protein n=1 Tax=Pseudomonas sp. TaxID=306 RepID=UPI003399E162